MNLEGGVGFELGQAGPLIGLGRVRVGLMWIDEADVMSPRYTSIGLMASSSGLVSGAFGLQAEWMWLNPGVWVQVGASLDTSTDPLFDLALGWSLLGVEGQLKLQDGDAVAALFAKVRIPLGVIGHALSD